MSDLLPPGFMKPLQKPKKERDTAKKVMKSRGYDPVSSLVDQHERLLEEDRYWCSVRDGTLVPVKGNGRTVRYSALAHTAILKQIQDVADRLLRYHYARVPEGDAAERGNTSPAPFIVQLEQGDYHVINGGDD